MQFRVPQNITMEDRIAGPLTLIQFTILVIGGGVSFLVYSSALPSPLNTVFGGGLALFSAMIALGKFNGQPMYTFFRFFVAYLTRPKVRVWHKSGEEIQLIKPAEAKKEERHSNKTPHLSKTDIQRLSQVLDSRGQNGVIPPVSQPPQPPAS